MALGDGRGRGGDSSVEGGPKKGLNLGQEKNPFTTRGPDARWESGWESANR